MSYSIFDRRLADEFPDDIRELLKLLEDEKVTIILESGEKETVEVEAVVGNLLVATFDGDCFKFIDIDCICAVIVDCKDILENIFKNKKECKKKSKAPVNTCDKQAYGWKLYQKDND